MRVQRLSALVAVLTITTPACNRGIPSETSVASKTEQPDTWDRSRQCADHSERLATRLERENPTDARIVGWSNHYNRKEHRCYVEIDFVNKSRPKTAVGVGPDLPFFFQRLYDAVESVELAGFTAAYLSGIQRSAYCRIPDSSDGRMTVRAECAVAHRFITERMTN
jgi:hypothetical protein